MAIELVTGHEGAAHVSSSDVGQFNARVLGTGAYVMGDAPAVAMVDANTCQITWNTADLLLNGRHVHCAGVDTVAVQNGPQTGYRNDIIYLRYSYDGDTGIEDVSIVTATGDVASTADTVEDPATEYSSSSILEGATTADFAIARVSFVGLAPTVEWLLRPSARLSGLTAHTVADRGDLHDVNGAALEFPCLVFIISTSEFSHLDASGWN